MMTTHPSLLDAVIPDASDSGYVPYMRRRNTPAQLVALQQLFEANPHPTRAQRQALANEIGMELRSVTNWFQNRRQSSRKKSHSSNENNPPKPRLQPSSAHHRRKPPLDRSKISLDHIATISERPSLTFQLNSQRLPLTPRKGNVQRKKSTSPSELWTHMLSSPAAPLSAPDPEEVRLAALSSRARTICPLEWACHKARQKKWVDEDGDGVSRCWEVNEDRTESEEITLGCGTVLSQSDISGLDKSVLLSRPKSEDVEAAITLLGFKTRS